MKPTIEKHSFTFEENQIEPHSLRATLPDDPGEPADPIGLLKSGHFASKVIQWITDTGVSVRARLPFLLEQTQPVPAEAGVMISGTTRLAAVGFVFVEAFLMWQFFY